MMTRVCHSIRQSSSCIGVYGSDDGLAWDNLGPDDKPVFQVRQEAMIPRRC
jgi:hypothetical protein